MSQYDFGLIDPAVKSGSQLAVDLNQWRDAMHSSHAAALRPPYVRPGMLWIEQVSGAIWNIRLNISATIDALVGAIDVATGIVSSSGGPYVPLAQKAVASGVASLDAGAKVPLLQVPDLSGLYIALAQKAAANGVASLDATGKVPAAQLPAAGASTDTSEIGNIVYRHAANAKHLWCNGQTVNKNTYPDLWAVAQGFVTGDQAANPGLYFNVDPNLFKLPNLNGYFIRNAGGNSAAMGAAQAAGLGGHGHDASASASGSGTLNGSGVVLDGVHFNGDLDFVHNQGNGFGQINLAAMPVSLSIGVSVAVAATGSGITGETRPANVALVPCVRALI